MRAIAAKNIQAKFLKLAPYLDERLRRLWAASEAEQMGYGGTSAVAAATGISRTTITAGFRELAAAESQRSVRKQSMEIATKTPSAGRVRQPGGGRKKLSQRDTSLLEALDQLVAPFTRGDPMSPLRWTCKSTQRLAGELSRRGHPVSARTVAGLLHQLDYSLQSNRKRLEGQSHPDRDAQFAHINQLTLDFQRRDQPVVSVDTKKKELVGEFKNGGREWRPKGQPEEVQVHDFIDKNLGKAIPYGIYDLLHNTGWVSVGVDHDTAEFATESLHRWWQMMGQPSYPHASELLIMADGGGSNSSRCRLWKWCLQSLADRTGLRLRVCHFPPATSKWNKIEHRMFCHITQNWRGQPLRSQEVVVELIGATTTREGLRIQAELDRGHYEAGRKITDAQMEQLSIERATFRGEWNYTIKPRIEGIT